jgi:hypothetical protein
LVNSDFDPNRSSAASASKIGRRFFVHTERRKSGALRAATRLDLHQSHKLASQIKLIRGRTMIDFEQAKKVLELTDARIKKFGSVDASMSREIHEAIFKFQPFQRLVIAYHAQEILTLLREQTVPLANSLEQLIATAIKLNHAEFREFAHPNMDKLA